jgi:ATP-dependent Clp protease adaptor protein ClpS
MGDYEGIPGGGLEDEGFVSTSETIEIPRLYRVLMHNDHYTTMDFVVEMLMKVFRKEEAEAYQIMMNIHTAGVGMCGVFTYDIARTKINDVHMRAREKGFPLRCSYEEA